MITVMVMAKNHKSRTSVQHCSIAALGGPQERDVRAASGESQKQDVRAASQHEENHK
jgi:hypothetical protein